MDLHQITFTVQILYVQCVGMDKISVLLLYKRIFEIPIPPAFKKVIRCSLGIIVAWSVAFSFATACMNL